MRIPVVQVSAPVAERLVAGSGRTLLELARTAETRGGVTPVPINAAVSAEGERRPSHRARSQRRRDARRRDPTLKNEHVLVSAHFDHDGADGPRIFNGADDDGSGTVGVGGDRRGVCAGGAGGAAAAAVGHRSPRGTPRSAGCSARGRTPKIRSCRSIASSPCSTWT